MTRVLLFITFLILMSCNNNTTTNKSEDEPVKSENETLYNEIMEVHDEVMPLMGKIVHLNKELRTSDTLSLSETQLSERTKAMAELKEADDAMMDWMYQFDQEKKDVKTYLEDQKTKVNAMADKMLESIENAENTLTEIKSQNE